MRKLWVFLLVVVSFLCLTFNANALLMGVTGPNSSMGTAPAIIGAPSDALDDIVFNTGMQGFNEAQGVTTTVNHSIDGGGSIAAGTLVDSHMIFLNSEGTARLSHFSVSWTFNGMILGVMSDQGGTLEAASTFELGAPGTNYTVTFPGSGPAAPFNARGIETNDGVGNGPNDGYLFAGNTITVGMLVTEPGDWIRVVTESQPIPEPATLILFGLGILGIAGFSRKKFRK